MKAKTGTRKRPYSEKNKKSSSSKFIPTKRTSTRTAAIVVLCAIFATQLNSNAGTVISKTIWDIVETIFPPKFNTLPWDDVSNLHFPDGCQWRDAFNSTKPNFWDIRHYEYWDESTNEWVKNQPAACRLTLEQPSSDYAWKNASRSGFHCTAEYCIINNMWYNQGRFFYLTDDEAGIVSA